MRPTYVITAFLALLLVATVSCKKSNPTSSSSASVQGNWNFLYMTANTSVSATQTGVTTVTHTYYKSKSNAGTIKFSADSMTVSGLTYTVDTTATVYVYYGTTLFDSVSAPFTYSLPATSQTVYYKVIGSDSIYLPNGGIVPAGYSGSVPASGGRFVIVNDTLKLTVQGFQSASGASESVNGTIYMKRQ
jgi:hypothetical protein